MSAAGAAVFLDRDGVLNYSVIRNGKPYPPATLEEFRIVGDAPSSLAELKRMGYLLIVVTNQPDVARGTQSRDIVEAMNQCVRESLPVDEILTCYHDDGDACACRKPRPGLLTQAAEKYRLDLARCVMIGDRWKDIDAGRAAGCATILLDLDYNERAPSVEPDARVSSLSEAVVWISEKSRKGGTTSQ